MGGPITVRRVAEIFSDQNALGLTHMQSRRILVADPSGAAEVPESSLISTFYHELFHMALWDSGLHNHFSDEQTEIVCDLVGSMMARMTTRP